MSLAFERRSVSPHFHPNPGQARALKLMQGPQRHTLLVGGSRSGKTHLIVRQIVNRSLMFEQSRHVILRFRGNAAWASIGQDTLPKVVREGFPGLTMDTLRGSYVQFPNGSQIWIGGLGDQDQVEKLLGNEYSTCFFNECSDIPYSSVLVARTRLAQVVPELKQRAFYDLNPGGSNHWTNLEFGEHKDPLTRQPVVDPENYQRCFLNPVDNAENLTPEFLASLANLPEKQRKRFYEGAYVNEVEGALWTYDSIERARVSGELPQFKRIVVAVDPSGAVGKENERSDEIGIVVCGLTPDGIGYVLEDCSVRDGPAVWGRVAVNAYHRWKADRIVAEINYGGAMVEFTIKAADELVPVTVMRGSRGKHVRAEPVSALYPDERSDGRIRHWGRFPDLEDQLTNFSTSGYIGERSPDRADAMVWGLTNLMIDVESTYDTTFKWVGDITKLGLRTIVRPLGRDHERSTNGAR